MRSVYRLTLYGLFTAMIALATSVLKVPGPTGYYHLGDALIYTAAVVLGPVFGGITGGVGSAVADLVGGFGVWAPWTFVIKGLTGLTVGYIAGSARRGAAYIAMIAGAVVTIVGYGVATSIMYDPAAAIGETLGNVAQTASGIVVASVLIPATRRALVRTVERRQES